MNERIKALAEQLGADDVKLPHGYRYALVGEENIQKFAELIVRECVAQNQTAIQSLKENPEDIPGWKTMMNLAQVTCKLQIGKHFEVDL